MVGDYYRDPRPVRHYSGGERIRDTSHVPVTSHYRNRIQSRLGVRRVLPLLKDCHVRTSSPHKEHKIKHRKPPRKENESSGKIYVRDLPEDVNREELEEVFGQFGHLKEVWIAQKPPGFAFIAYCYVQDAKKAVEALDGKDVCGAKVTVELSKKRETTSMGSSQKKKKKLDQEGCSHKGRKDEKKPSEAKKNVERKKSERSPVERGQPRPRSRIVASTAVKARAAKVLQKAKARVTGQERHRMHVEKHRDRRAASPGWQAQRSPLPCRRHSEAQDGERGLTPRKLPPPRRPPPRRPPPRSTVLSPRMHRSPTRRQVPSLVRRTFSHSPTRDTRYDRFATERDPYRYDAGALGYHRRGINGSSSWRSPQCHDRSPPRHRYTPLQKSEPRGRDGRNAGDLPAQPMLSREYYREAPPMPYSSSLNRYRDDVYHSQSPRRHSPPSWSTPRPVPHQMKPSSVRSQSLTHHPVQLHPRSPVLQYSQHWNHASPHSPPQPSARSPGRRHSYSPLHKGEPYRAAKERYPPGRPRELASQRGSVYRPTTFSRIRSMPTHKWNPRRY